MRPKPTLRLLGPDSKAFAEAITNPPLPNTQLINAALGYEALLLEIDQTQTTRNKPKCPI